MVYLINNLDDETSLEELVWACLPYMVRSVRNGGIQKIKMARRDRIGVGTRNSRMWKVNYNQINLMLLD